MKQSYDFNIKQIKNLSVEEKDFRQKNLDLFYKSGFPSKTIEDWKFTDLNLILNKNFESISNEVDFESTQELETIENFKHNYIFLSNGKITSTSFVYEETNKILIKDFDQKELTNFNSNNTLTLLNNALSSGGFSLEVAKNYKLKKPLIIYNYFSKGLKNKILNNKNSIKLNEGSELTLIEYTNGYIQSNFIKNTLDIVSLDKDAVLKNILIQKSKSNGHFYRYIKGSLESGSNYENYILSSGLKLNKIEIEINLNKDHSNCSIYSALNLVDDQHQEIKTLINHNSPNCKSHQKIKNVLNDKSRGVYQGKIFVKKIAQKTDAYQLSKALILNDDAEFDAKPELEIYADDVKCSHGSTSGSIDSDAVHYLMTRGIAKKEAEKLLINGFLGEILENIYISEVKTFLEEILERQINGH
ncbi:MAG: Fe-S cluster assembly protein SufD [Pelagibacteraceae bacterium]|jgi:Fe-S cluster assembly protein SufD|nr:Fe-S cluster assembly protein SufD [Pelagibacteraceae bacterium]